MTSYLSEEQFELKFEAAMMNTYDKFFAASPVKTGFLRSMIKPIKTSNGFVIEISEVPYAIWTEIRNSTSKGWFERTFTEAYYSLIKELTT